MEIDGILSQLKEICVGGTTSNYLGKCHLVLEERWWGPLLEDSQQLL